MTVTLMLAVNGDRLKDPIDRLAKICQQALNMNLRRDRQLNSKHRRGPEQI